MKKALSIVLSTVLMVVAVSCFAETAAVTVKPAFEIIPILPESYSVTYEDWADPYLCLMTFESSDPQKPTLQLLVGYNDGLEYLTFNDETIKSEDVQLYIDSISYDYELESAIPYTVQNTGLGTGVVIFNRTNATEFYSIWHGYEISLYAFNTDENGTELPLTDEQVTAVMQFLTDMDFAKVVHDEVEESA